MRESFESLPADGIRQRVVLLDMALPALRSLTPGQYEIFRDKTVALMAAEPFP